MRAHVLSRYGKKNDVLQFTEAPRPPLGAHEVRIDVEAVALNPVDLKTREGEPKMLLPFAPPFVPGTDLAGRVVEVGNKVTTLRVGDPVLAYTGMDRMGAFAESVVVPADRVARRPDTLAADHAACLPLPGLCALQSLDAAEVKAGTRVLVHGGAGGVGSLAVQLARRRGAEVYATASAADLDAVRALGATTPIDFRAQRFEDVAREVDVVFDTVGGETLTRSWAAVRRGGTVVSLHVPPPAPTLLAAGLRAPWILRLLLPLVTRGARAAAAKAGARLVPMLTVPSADGLTRLLAQEAPRVTFGPPVAFERLGEALDRLERRQGRGRVVLTRS